MTGMLFAPEGPRRVALMRIGLGLLLLWHAGSRWRYAVELYSTFGPAMPIFWRGEPSPPFDPLPAHLIVRQSTASPYPENKL